MNPQDLISDKEVEIIHENAQFGDMDKRDVLRESVLKVAAGLHIGYTAQQIVFEHGLVNTITERPKLTKLGQQYLWATYNPYTESNFAGKH